MQQKLAKLIEREKANIASNAYTGLEILAIKLEKELIDALEYGYQASVISRNKELAEKKVAVEMAKKYLENPVQVDVADNTDEINDDKFSNGEGNAMSSLSRYVMRV